jgi:hypothetical protein
VLPLHTIPSVFANDPLRIEDSRRYGLRRLAAQAYRAKNTFFLQTKNQEILIALCYTDIGTEKQLLSIDSVKLKWVFGTSDKA